MEELKLMPLPPPRSQDELILANILEHNIDKLNEQELRTYKSELEVDIKRRQNWINQIDSKLRKNRWKK